MFDVTGSAHEVSTRWKKWKRSFTYYADGNGISDETRKKNLLLHLAGLEVQDIFDTLPEPPPVPADDDARGVFDTAILKLDAYFAYEPNYALEKHNFRLMSQLSSETVAQFAHRLKQQAKLCNFTTAAEHELDQLVEGVRESSLRKKFLDKKNLDIVAALEIARQHETTEESLRGMASSASGAHASVSGSVNRVRVSSKHSSDSTCSCRNCGRTGHVAGDDSCPARSKSCHKCGKKGHFRALCRQSGGGGSGSSSTGGGSATSKKNKHKVNKVEESELAEPEAECDFAFGVSLGTGVSESSRISVRINDVVTDVLVDSGATCNILRKDVLEELRSGGLHVDVSPCTRKLYTYGSNLLPVIGKFQATVEANGKSTEDEFIVIAGTGEFLLGRPAAMKLNVLILPEVCSVSSQEEFSAGLQKQYPGVFAGVGKLVGYQAHLHVNPDVSPVPQRERRVPYLYQPKVAAKLEELQQHGIIQEATGPTPWVSPVVIAPKRNGDIRLCVDLRRVNEAMSGNVTRWPWWMTFFTERMVVLYLARLT